MDEDPAFLWSEEHRKVLPSEIKANTEAGFIRRNPLCPFLTAPQGRRPLRGCRARPGEAQTRPGAGGGSATGVHRGSSPLRPQLRSGDAGPLGSRRHPCRVPPRPEAVPHQRPCLGTPGRLLSAQLDQIRSVKIYVLFL